MATNHYTFVIKWLYTYVQRGIQHKRKLLISKGLSGKLLFLRSVTDI